MFLWPHRFPSSECLTCVFNSRVELSPPATRTIRLIASAIIGFYPLRWLTPSNSVVSSFSEGRYRRCLPILDQILPLSRLAFFFCCTGIFLLWTLFHFLRATRSISSSSSVPIRRLHQTPGQCGLVFGILWSPPSLVRRDVEGSDFFRRREA